MRFAKYQNYIWVYILGAILVFANHLWIQNIYMAHVCLGVLFCILFYKGVHIIRCYWRTEKKEYESIDKKKFADTYTVFRVKVLGFWLAFTCLCIVGKFVLQIDRQYFYCCTYFFLFLDRIFVNVGCLLQKWSDPKGVVVICCCGCPCRGWDLLMIHTPLLFALHPQGGLWNVLICLSSILAVVSMVYWERDKYRLVEVRGKCKQVCDLHLCREHK